MESRIGIITYGDDPHGHLVKKKIEEQHGAWCCLIPSDELARRGRLTWSSQSEAPVLLPTIDGQTVDVRTLNAQWYRRMTSKQALPEGADAAYELHILRSTERVFEGILLNEFQGRWVSHPIATRLAENKLVQLRAAQRAGLRTPATLVSQDPARIRGFCAAHPGAIIKPVATPREVELASTAVVSQELLDNEEVLALTVSIYQEYVPGKRHLRISVVGERCDGALIEAEALDWRMDLNVPFSPYPLDSHLEQRLRATLRQLGLVMGIFDVKLTDDDEPVFLEVNPQGQFLFVEGLCGIPLADAVADFLVAQARENSRGRSSGRPRPGTPDRNAVNPRPSRRQKVSDR
jgi:glutathione synthase/RimK-type ligase-like ATP-grasp enzyme